MPLSTRAALAAALVCASAPALAMEPLGSITGTLDGNSRVWRTLDGGELEAATATIRIFGPVAMLDIQGHDPDGESMMRGVLSINVGVMGSADAPQIMDASVSYFPDGMGRAFYLADEEAGAVDIAFDRMNLSGSPAATGVVNAELCHKSGIFAPPDEDDCLVLEARFETQLRSDD